MGAIPYAGVAAFFLLYVFLKRRPVLYFWIFFLKILFALVSCYLVINRYDFGDLWDYYVTPKYIEIEILTLYQYYLDTRKFIPIIYAIILQALGPSIYGLAILSGISSSIYTIMLYKTYLSVRRSSVVPHGFNRWLILVFFFYIIVNPYFSIMSGYIGKELICLPAIGYIFYGLISPKNNSRLGFGIVVSITLLILIRPYQGIFILVSYYGAKLVMRPSAVLSPITLTLGLVLSLLISQHVQVSETLLKFQELGIADTIGSVYGTGSYSGDFLVVPFVGAMRPFIWDAASLALLTPAIINTFILGTIIIFMARKFLIKKTVKCKSPARSESFPFYFIIVWVSVNTFFFGFSENIGDLIRRQIYYVPQLLLGLILLGDRRSQCQKIN